MSGSGPGLLPAGLAEESKRTWANPRPGISSIPDALLPPRTRNPRARVAALRRRHRMRGRSATDFVQHAMNPARGLPVADDAATWAFLRSLIWQRRGWLVALVLTNGLAAAAAVLVPRMLGTLVDDTARLVSAGQRDTAVTGAASAAAAVAVVVLVQALFTGVAKVCAAVLGQGVLAQAREDVVRSVLRLPLSRVEGSGTGDLVTRVTRDVSAMSESVRLGVPEGLIACVSLLLTLAAMAVNSLPLSLPTLALMAVACVQVRRYLHQAPAGYLTEGGTYSQINTTLTETVEGARTVEALRLKAGRWRRGEADLATSAQAERYTLTLRNLLFIVMDIAFALPRALTLAIGAVGYARGWVSLGQITAAMLYVEAIAGPFDTLVHNIDRIQVGVTSTTRLLGIATVPPDRTPTDQEPQNADLEARQVTYAYRPGHDVLHGIDLTLRPGERLAVVGPSGSGKSTLGRLLAGVHAPGRGHVTLGGVDLTDLPLARLRHTVALVTQEHHVFLGTLRDNVALARLDADDAQVEAALRAVDAWEWVAALPEGLDTRVGSGREALTPGRAQQVALARLVLADPATLVLDEATSLIDPRTARHLEGSMNALLTGRTVVAIAHRLHTAHDADRIAVVIDGRIAELGSHDDLVRQQGEYAALWRAWTT